MAGSTNASLCVLRESYVDQLEPHDHSKPGLSEKPPGPGRRGGVSKAAVNAVCSSLGSVEVKSQVLQSDSF